jgi:cold shock CspA family protein
LDLKQTDGYGVFLRNSQISHSKIVNLNRGSKISFEVQFGLNWDTTAKEVAALNKRLGEYFKNSKVRLFALKIREKYLTINMSESERVRE